jgi:hypothetical protein
MQILRITLILSLSKEKPDLLSAITGGMIALCRHENVKKIPCGNPGIENERCPL